MAPGRSRGVAVKYRIALAFFATSCLAGVAVAADLPIGGPLYRGPFVARQPVEWTGIYFGANAGYGWGQHASNIIFTGSGTNGLTNPIPGPFPNFFTGVFPTIAGPTELSGTRVTGSADLNGAIAGGQIGFNWQAGMFVFGAELDGQWSGQETTFTVNCGAGCTASETVKIRSLLTGRGRVGLAFDWIMPYVTGGAALINGIDNLTMTVAGTTASFQPLSGSTLGWTAGGGVELALWSNWSAKLEYLYVRANGATVNAPIPNALGTGTATTPMEYRDNIVRVGFNYRFGPRGGPGVLEFADRGAGYLRVEHRFLAELAVRDRQSEHAGRSGQPGEKPGSCPGQAGRRAGHRNADRADGERSGAGREASRPQAGCTPASRVRHKRTAVLDGR